MTYAPKHHDSLYGMQPRSPLYILPPRSLAPLVHRHICARRRQVDPEPTVWSGRDSWSNATG